MKHVIRYNSTITNRRMFVESIGPDPTPGDEFGRHVLGCTQLANAHQFTPEFALEMLPKVREVHRDSWIERADGSRIDPNET